MEPAPWDPGSATPVDAGPRPAPDGGTLPKDFSGYSLRFDGAEVVLLGPEGRDLLTLPAVSGRPDTTAGDQFVRDVGPIPEGQYWLRTEDILDHAPGMVARFLLNPLGLTDWGQYHVPIEPRAGTDTGGRDGFNIHGGVSRGSAGCIDVGPGDEKLFPVLMGIDGLVLVIVDYDNPNAFKWKDGDQYLGWEPPPAGPDARDELRRPQDHQPPPDGGWFNMADDAAGEAQRNNQEAEAAARGAHNHVEADRPPAGAGWFNMADDAAREAQRNNQEAEAAARGAHNHVEADRPHADAAQLPGNVTAAMAAWDPTEGRPPDAPLFTQPHQGGVEYVTANLAPQGNDLQAPQLAQWDPEQPTAPVQIAEGGNYGDVGPVPADANVTGQNFDAFLGADDNAGWGGRHDGDSGEGTGFRFPTVPWRDDAAILNTLNNRHH